MKTKFKNKKGFTLIELIVVLSIVVIVIGAVSSFLISNIRTFNMASDQVEAQDEANKAMNAFIDKVIGTAEIDAIINEQGTAQLKDSLNEIDDVTVLEFIDDSDMENPVYPAFKIDRTDKNNIKLYFRTNSLQMTLLTTPTIQADDLTGFTQVADNLTAFKLTPIGATDQSYTGLKITITVKKNDSEVTLNNEVYFRNRKK